MLVFWFLYFLNRFCISLYSCVPISPLIGTSKNPFILKNTEKHVPKYLSLNIATIEMHAQIFRYSTKFRTGKRNKTHQKSEIIESPTYWNQDRKLFPLTQKLRPKIGERRK